MAIKLGDVFSGIVVLEYTPRNHRGYWRCRCHCGKEFTTRGDALTEGRTSSCGCATLALQIIARTKHGKHNTPEYHAWEAMKARCCKAHHPGFNDYGGRGIKVCDRWLNSFENFLADMGRKPTPKHSIDRIDNDGDYTPENCRWATIKQQNSNKRINRWVTLRGKSYTITQLAEYYYMPSSVLRIRLKHGWSIDMALSTPIEVRRKAI